MKFSTFQTRKLNIIANITLSAGLIQSLIYSRALMKYSVHLSLDHVFGLHALQVLHAGERHLRWSLQNTWMILLFVVSRNSRHEAGSAWTELKWTEQDRIRSTCTRANRNVSKWIDLLSCGLKLFGLDLHCVRLRCSVWLWCTHKESNKFPHGWIVPLSCSYLLVLHSFWFQTNIKWNSVINGVPQKCLSLSPFFNCSCSSTPPFFPTLRSYLTFVWSDARLTVATEDVVPEQREGEQS